MARLLVLRHGKTEFESASGRDLDRELVARGRRNAADMGRLIRERLPVPGIVLASPSARTRQTADCLLATLDPEAAPVIDDRIYGGSDRTLLDVVHEHAGDAASALLIGHNPGMILLVRMLAADAGAAAQADHFPTCALADIGFDAATLGGAGPGLGGLRSLLRPKELGFVH